MLVWPKTVRDGKFKYNSLDKSENQKDHTCISEDDLFEFLKKRRNKLESVVITGGEPTLQKDLPEFIEKIKKLGYLVKLDTNGTDPEMIEKMIDAKLIDYIAMDIKAPLEKYESVVGANIDLAKIKKSIKIIMTNKIPYEFRTTVVPELITQKDINEIGKMIENSEKWFIQGFKSEGELVDREFEKKIPYAERNLIEMCNIGKKYVKVSEIR